MMVAAIAGSGAGAAQAAETGFLNRAVTLGGVGYAYQVYVPRAYNASKTWPIILALHGAGERGDDGLLQTEVGLGNAIRRHAERYPAVVVFPQARLDEIWQGRGADVALAALDASMSEYNIDSSRVYLTGISMGGNGSWYLAYHHPERFAALVVVCGWISERREGLYPAIVPPSAGDPFAAVAQRVARIPVWIFHGEADDVVPVEESRRMAAALRAIGADVRYTELPDVGHGAWEPAYALAELPVWLLQQQIR